MNIPDAASAAPDENTSAPTAGTGALGEPAAEPVPAKGKRSRWLFGVLGPLVVIGVFGYVLATHGSDIGHAADRVSAGTLVLITVLALVTLLARTEEAVICMTAMNRRPGRADIHAASSFSFLLSTVNHYIAGIARAAILQRLDRERSPTIPQMVVIDGSTYLIEGLLAGLLLIVSAGALNLAWWLPALAILAAVGALAVALYLRRRFHHQQIFNGLEMLGHSRYRAIIVLLTVLIFACQIGRTLIVLQAVGLHPSLLQAVATFIAGGVLSNLLAGPGGGTAAAPLVIFGHQSLGAATAAGLILSGAALLAAIIYTVATGPILVWRLRRRRRARELPVV
jgi:uncharacterized membrane protein YbhN (UPF0104 family)